MEALDVYVEDFEDIELHFIQHMVTCVKYNYNVTSEQKQRCYDALIQMNPDGRSLTITKKIVKEKIVQLYNTDPRQIHKLNEYERMIVNKGQPKPKNNNKK